MTGELTEKTFGRDRIRSYEDSAVEHGTIAMMSEEARRASMEAIRRTIQPGEDIWLFAYASLMWMPSVPVAETKRAYLRGHHRSFCLKIDIELASVERPGLLMGTEPHGGCAGVAHRIAAADVTDALPMLWYRKMMTGAYEARWISVQLEGAEKVKSLVFVSNRHHVRFEKLPYDEIVRRIATAEGKGGTNRGYLYSTIDCLHRYGIVDPDLERVAADVRALAGD